MTDQSVWSSHYQSTTLRTERKVRAQFEGGREGEKHPSDGYHCSSPGDHPWDPQKQRPSGSQCTEYDQEE